MAKPVEFTAKVRRSINPKNLDEEERSFREAQRIIGNISEDEDIMEMEIDYKRLILDLELIADTLELDEEHVQVVMKHQVIYILKINYEHFKEIYERVTLQIIVETEAVNK